MSTLGWIHTIFAVIALLTGAVVLVRRKGGRWHRTLGHFYLTSMVTLNVTGLFITRLYGGFGPFHWMALISLLTLLAGMVPVLTRRPRGGWLEQHAAFLSGSYVGLLAAAASEVTSRLPGTEAHFGLVVGGTSAVIIAAGVILIRRYQPGSVARTPVRAHEPAGAG